MNDVINVKNLTIEFELPTEKTDSLKEWIVKFLTGKLSYNKLIALNDVSFKVKQGEIVGILGANGSGKSTLLKCLCGIYSPTNGEIIVNGKIAPLIELGAGFDPELTAKENVFLSGAVLGLSKHFMKEKYNEIVEFSELGQFMDVQVKNFSSGMYARLGFSVATSVKPEILIVDEILGVGDAAFQEKCHERMENLRANNITMLFVSHSLSQVRELCTRAIWLRRGVKVMDGDCQAVCDAYEDWISGHSAFE